MLFIKLENSEAIGYPVIEANFRQLIPNGNKVIITKEIAKSAGFGIYEYGQKPSAKKYEVIEESEILLSNSGTYVQQYQSRPMTEEEIQEEDNFKAMNEREERDYRLRNQVDRLNPIRWNLMNEEKKQEWINYRDALLAIPDQEGFPWDIEWPVLPE